jgi:hypothetical protein
MDLSELCQKKMGLNVVSHTQTVCVRIVGYASIVTMPPRLRYQNRNQNN